MSVEESSGSITAWICSLKHEQDDRATEKIWNKYFTQLLQITKRRLANRNVNRRVSDEEDIVVATFHDVFQQAKEGRFPSLYDRDDLWKLLLKISEYKSINKNRDDNRLKRGDGRVRGDSYFGARPNESGFGQFDHAQAPEPTPELSAIMEEQCSLLLRLLDQKQQDVVTLKLRNHTNPEIASRLDCSLATIERRLSRIRQIWNEYFESESSG